MIIKLDEREVNRITKIANEIYGQENKQAHDDLKFVFLDMKNSNHVLLSELEWLVSQHIPIIDGLMDLTDHKTSTEFQKFIADGKLQYSHVSLILEEMVLPGGAFAD